MAAALLDSNVLIHAAYKRAPFHSQAAHWWSRDCAVPGDSAWRRRI